MILMDSRVALVTVRFAVPLIDPDVALMMVRPAATAVAKPCVPAELLMVATVPSDELQ